MNLKRLSGVRIYPFPIDIGFLNEERLVFQLEKTLVSQFPLFHKGKTASNSPEALYDSYCYKDAEHRLVEEWRKDIEAATSAIAAK